MSKKKYANYYILIESNLMQQTQNYDRIQHIVVSHSHLDTYPRISDGNIRCLVGTDVNERLGISHDDLIVQIVENLVDCVYVY